MSEFLERLSKTIMEGHFSSKSPHESAKRAMKLIHDECCKEAFEETNKERYDNMFAWRFLVAFEKRVKECGGEV